MPATVTDNKTETITRLMPLYRVMLHNDDINEMSHVVRALVEVFRFEIQEAVPIMIEAHESGCALCKIEPLETAELHQEQLQAFSLVSTIEPDA
jgi:ATP-dependent Clp protease adaptor protein ClpS